MPRTGPTRVGIREAREVFPTLVDEAAAGARFVVTFHGKDRCAIVPLSDLPGQQKPVQAKPVKRRPK